MKSKNIFLKNILILFLAVFIPCGSLFAQVAAREVAMLAAFNSREIAMLAALREREIASALEKMEVQIGRSPSTFKGQKPLDVIFASAHPYASLTTRYTDNFFGTQFETVSEVVNTLDPGVKFVFSGKKDAADGVLEKVNQVELKMGTKLVSLSNRHKYDDQYPYGELNAQIGRGGHKIHLGQSYAENYGLGTELTLGDDSIFYTANSKTDVSYEADYRKVGYELGYNDAITYPTGDLKTNSSNIQTFTVTAFLKPRAFPKTRFFLEYDYAWTDYPKSLSDSKNSIDRKYLIGAKGKLAGKTTGSVKFGKQISDLKSSTRDTKTTTVDINVDYTFSPITAFNFTVSKGTVTSTLLNENDAEKTTVSLNAKHTFSSHRKFAFALGLNYGNFKASSGRKSKSFGGSTQLTVNFNKWLNSSLQYSYSKTDSEAADGSYRSNDVILMTEAKF